MLKEGEHSRSDRDFGFDKVTMITVAIQAVSGLFNGPSINLIVCRELNYPRETRGLRRYSR
jgi:hypothetical protein